MLYTPLSAEKRRSTKTLIDVGFDRFGTVAAAVVVAVALAVAGVRAEMVLLVLAVAVALVTLTRSRALHRGYVAVLEESLRKEAAEAGVALAPVTVASDERLQIRDSIVEHLVALPSAQAMVAIATGDVQRASELSGDAPRAPGQDTSESFDASLSAVAELRSHDPERVHRVLSSAAPLPRPVVAFAILLLADKALHTGVVRGLRASAAKNTGQLVDALCDEGSPLDIRRRVPRVLSECPTQDAADGLVRGMADARFEVRYECARALLRITGANPAIRVGVDIVLALVKRELALGKDVWESQRATEVDEDDDEAPALIDRLLRDRLDRSLEHVFTLLALHLDRQSLRLAFAALHEEGDRLRGTALEYLETVLPEEVRDAVWPFLGAERPMRSPRSAQEILADLRRAPDALAAAAAPGASHPTA
jgi:AAA family ATP:ADP antiporter